MSKTDRMTPDEMIPNAMIQNKMTNTGIFETKKQKKVEIATVK
jgi:hypothetical protein